MTPTAKPVTSASRLSRKVAGGAAWLFGQTVSARLISLGAQIVLARLLFPADYAVLALAGTVSAVVNALTDFGVGEVALQRHTRVRFWTGTVFWLSLALATAGMAALLGLAPLAASLYESPTLTAALSFIALSLPFTALSSVPTLNLNAQLRFRALAAFGVFDIAAQQAGTIALAYAGYGAMSFFVPLSIVAIAKAALLWMYVRPRIRAPRRAQFSIIFRRALSVLGERAATMVVAQGDYMIIGLSANKPMVGAYYFAFRLSVQPVRMVAGSLSKVLLPSLISLQGDPAWQDRAALRAARLLGFLVMPLCALQAALAPAGTRLLFGEKWTSAVAFIQILSIGLAFDSVSWVASALLRARGRFDLAFRYALYVIPVFFSLATIGFMIADVSGVAVGVALVYALMAPVYSFLIFRNSGLGGAAVIQLYVVPFCLSAVCFGAVYETVRSFVSDPLLELFAIGVLAPLAFGVAVRFLAPSAFHEIAEFVASLANRSVSRASSRPPTKERGVL